MSTDLTIGAPRLEQRGDQLIYSWPDEEGELGAVRVVMDGVRSHSDGLHAQMEVRYSRNGTRGHIYGPVRVNLLSPRSRKDTSSQLGAKRPALLRAPVWENLLEQVYAITARQYHSGGGFVDLAQVAEPTEVRYLVNKVLPLGQTSVIFADGGGCKGWLAMAVAVSVMTGCRLPGGLLPTEVTRVLYLDWEMQAEEIRRRLGWVCRGLGVREIPRLFYKQMSGRSLADSVGFLRNFIANEGIGMVIVDSLVPATNAEPRDAWAATACMDAINSLPNTSRLVLAHITKEAARDPKGTATIFGSAMYNNLGRSNWQLRSAGHNPELDLALVHKKVNLGPLFPAIGLHLSFDDEAHLVRLSGREITDNRELAAGLPISQQITAELRYGSATTAELVEATGVRQGTLLTTLGRMVERGQVVKVRPEVPSKGLTALWGLAADREPDGPPSSTAAGRANGHPSTGGWADA